MKEIPLAFLERMSRLLGDEYPAFLASYTKAPTIGLRINTLKITPEKFRSLIKFPLDPISWSPAGFRLCNEVLTGRHIYFAAGLYYLQEPSAMGVAELLSPQPGERVLDLCAAPGGKTTHAAALMKNEGLLVANEIHPKRAWDLAENMERCGVRNALITNETPKQLINVFSGYFDKVVVDAPCSGEGMFRKSERARSEWSLDLVNGCANRQYSILEDAALLLRSGGKLVYSTCTFSPEENEEVLSRFLSTHPDFDLLEHPIIDGFYPGRPDWVREEFKPTSILNRAIRLWPHHIKGEGHFIAILMRCGSSADESTPLRISEKSKGFRSRKQGRDQKMHHNNQDILKFFHIFCNSIGFVSPPDSELIVIGTYLYQISSNLPDLQGLKVIHPGWWLGSFKKGRFEPSHALALGLRVEQINNRISFNIEDPHIENYLRGESFPSQGSNNWVLVDVNGFPIGWGKRVQGVLKNYYPIGLRWK